jgi:hypothetical protein
MNLEAMNVEEEELAFEELADKVLEVIQGEEIHRGFVATATVMLDTMQEMLIAYEDPTVSLMLINQIHSEFIRLMSESGYDLSNDNKQ